MSYASILARSSLGTQPRLVKLIIAGSRSLVVSDHDIAGAMDRLLDAYDLIPSEIVSGNACGVDRCGEAYARSVGMSVKVFPVTPAEWQRYGKSAGHRRNAEMARYADALLAFWDGKSPGTSDMIRQMRGLKKPALVVTAKNGRCS